MEHTFLLLHCSRSARPAPLSLFLHMRFSFVLTLLARMLSAKDGHLVGAYNFGMLPLSFIWENSDSHLLKDSATQTVSALHFPNFLPKL